jgi:hypothetical protein
MSVIRNTGEHPEGATLDRHAYPGIGVSEPEITKQQVELVYAQATLALVVALVVALLLALGGVVSCRQPGVRHSVGVYRVVIQFRLAG